jgi:hypothetical protein
VKRRGSPSAATINGNRADNAIAGADRTFHVCTRGNAPAGRLLVCDPSVTHEFVGLASGDAAANLPIKVLTADGRLSSADFMLRAGAG